MEKLALDLKSIEIYNAAAKHRVGDTKKKLEQYCVMRPSVAIIMYYSKYTIKHKSYL